MKNSKFEAQISTYYNESGRQDWSITNFDSLEKAEKYVSGWIMYSEDNVWRYYQREQLKSNHDISTWIRIKKLKCKNCGEDI